MAHTGKKYKAALAKIDRTKRYSIEEGFALLESTKIGRKWDETVDVAVRLGVDPKHADQNVRGACVLPHGTGKTVRVIVFAKGDKVKEAQDAGADFVGGDDLVTKIQGGWLEFDTAVATPDMMGPVGKIAKILGPRGLMPNPKVGTVTFDLAKAIREVKAGKVEFRVEKAGIVQTPIGKISFGIEKLRGNFTAITDMLMKLKPSSAKGVYIKTISISTTMGPGIKLDPQQVLDQHG